MWEIGRKRGGGYWLLGVDAAAVVFCDAGDLAVVEHRALECRSTRSGL